MSRRIATLSLAFLSLVVGLRSAQAGEYSLTPFIGAALPTQSLLVSETGLSSLRMTTSTVFGLALGTALSDRIDLELAGAVGSGKMEISATGIEAAATTMMTGDLRARIRLAGGDDGQLGLLAGVGLTQFSNGIVDAFHESDPDSKFESKVTGVAGLGVRTRVSERMRLTIDVADRIHDQNFKFNTTGFIEKTQHDVTITAGLNLPLR